MGMHGRLNDHSPRQLWLNPHLDYDSAPWDADNISEVRPYISLGGVSTPSLVSGMLGPEFMSDVVGGADKAPAVIAANGSMVFVSGNQLLGTTDCSQLPVHILRTRRYMQMYSFKRRSIWAPHRDGGPGRRLSDLT